MAQPSSIPKRCRSVIVTLGLIVLGLTTPAFSQVELPEKESAGKVKKAPAPEWVKRHEFDVYEEPEQKENIGSVYYFAIDSQRDTASETEYFRYIKRLMTESGVADYSQLSISFDPSYQSLIFHSLLVHRDGKTIDKLPDQNIKVIERESNHEKQLYDGSLSGMALIEDIRVGDTIEYSFSLVGKNPVMEDRYSESFSCSFSSPVGHWRSSLRWDGERELKMKHFRTDLVPLITEEESHTLYEWTHDHIPALLSDGVLPSDYSPWGLITLSDYESWDEVKEWALRQYEFPDTLPESLEKEITPILNAAKSDEEKIRAALRYVQDEYRYLGIFSGVHSHKPYPLDTIVKRRFGDCKDKSQLLTTILRSAGINAYPALVETDYRSKISDWLPTPYAFDHLVVTVRHQGETIRLDPTRAYQRGPLKDIYFPAYGQALVISPDAEGLEPVKPQGYEVKTTEVTEDYNFPDYKGGATLKVTTKYVGRSANSLRSYFASNGNDEIEKDYINFYSSIFPDIKFAGPITTKDDEIGNILVVQEDYEISNIWNPVDEENEDEGFEVELFAKSVYQQIDLPSTRVRTMPYALRYPDKVKQTINASFPTSTSFTGTDLDVEDPAFSYTAKEIPKESGIQLVYTYETKKNRVEAKEVADYIKSARKARRKSSYEVWIPSSLHLGKDSTNSEDTTSHRFNFTLVVLILISLVFFTLIAFRVARWSPGLLLAPSNPSTLNGLEGWLILFIIGAAFNPLVSLMSIGTVIYSQDLDSWLGSITPGENTYDAIFQYLITSEAVLYPMLLVFEILLLVMFFTKRYTFPKVAVAYLLVSLTVSGMTWAMAAGISEFDEESLQAYEWHTYKSFFQLIVWGPYFAMSVRVRNTFIVGGPKQRPKPPPLPPVTEQPTGTASNFESEISPPSAE